jgi:23S rRNA (uracil1939-C5)-methyltransferase
MSEQQGAISGYSHQGAGVVRGEGQVCFIPGALQGETVIFEIEEEASGISAGSGTRRAKKAGPGKVAFGELKKVLAPSEHRIEPQCPFYGSCGGCQLQHADYKHQLQIKHDIVERAFRGLGREESAKIEVLPVLGAHTPWGYRNKGLFAVQKQEGKVKIGFYQSKSRVVAGNGCPGLFSELVNGLIQALSFWLEQAGAEIGAQGLHHIMIRESKTTGQLILVLIGAGEKPGWLPDFLKSFVPKDPKSLPPLAPVPKQLLLGIGWLTADLKEGPVLEGKPETLWGSLSLMEHLGKVRYGISPESFFQVNTAQAKVLYEQALKLAGLTGKEHVWDLYSGTGTIALYLAAKAKSVLAIESVAAAVKDGQTNARLNKIDNVKFMTGLAESVLPVLLHPPVPEVKEDAAALADKVAARWQKMAQAAAEAVPAGETLKETAAEAESREQKRREAAGLPDVVVMDPPSKGCEPAVIDAVLEAAPQRIVYVSCDPATLVRDLKRIIAGGAYEIKAVQPVDMFPQTGHVESVVLLSRTEGTTRAD